MDTSALHSLCPSSELRAARRLSPRGARPILGYFRGRGSLDERPRKWLERSLVEARFRRRDRSGRKTSRMLSCSRSEHLMQRSLFSSAIAVVTTSVLVLNGGAAAPARGDDRQPQVPDLKVEKYTLPNGLQVILHEDHTTPTVGGQHLVQGRLEERETGADRVRPPVRAPDVPGVAASRRRVLRPDRDGSVPRSTAAPSRIARTTSRPCRATRWSWRCGSSRTAWASSSPP